MHTVTIMWDDQEIDLDSQLALHVGIESTFGDLQITYTVQEQVTDKL